MKLKVCGMKYKDNITAVANLQPDFMGFIFYKTSARNFEDLGSISVPSSIKKVGVFVDEAIAVVKGKIKEFNLQVVQLHGNESPEYCNELKRHFEKQSDRPSTSKESDYRDYQKKLGTGSSVEIIKVFSIKDEFNFEVLRPYEAICDYYLFDTKGKLPGGNGYAFNWDVLKKYPSTKPYFLSGGIGIGDLEKIKAFKKNPASKYCYAIDVNSKFEIEAGLKNSMELAKFKTLLV